MSPWPDGIPASSSRLAVEETAPESKGTPASHSLRGLGLLGPFSPGGMEPRPAEEGMSLQRVPAAWGCQRQLSWVSALAVGESCSHGSRDALQDLSGLSSASEGK